MTTTHDTASVARTGASRKSGRGTSTWNDRYILTERGAALAATLPPTGADLTPIDRAGPGQRFAPVQRTEVQP